MLRVSVSMIISGTVGFQKLMSWVFVLRIISGTVGVTGACIVGVCIRIVGITIESCTDFDHIDAVQIS